MIDHWYWRPGWHVGRSFYTWHLTFEDNADVQALAARYHQYIHLPFLDQVPLEWLHMTLQGIAFSDEVSDGDLNSIRDAAYDRCRQIQEFDLQVGAADADEQGIPLAIRPWEPVIDLRTALRAAITDVWGIDGVPESADGFMPHITVFYSNSAADPSPLRPLLAALRSTLPITTTVREVSLIKLNRDHKVYQWERIASIPLKLI
jgi:2'-5' RNA ligase